MNILKTPVQIYVHLTDELAVMADGTTVYLFEIDTENELEIIKEK